MKNCCELIMKCMNSVLHFSVCPLGSESPSKGSAGFLETVSACLANSHAITVNEVGYMTYVWRMRSHPFTIRFSFVREKRQSLWGPAVVADGEQRWASRVRTALLYKES